MDYEPGPIPLEDGPPIVRVVPEGYFLSLAAPMMEGVDFTDQYFAGLNVQIGEPLPVDMDGEFQQTIAVAEDALENEPPEGSFSPIEQVEHSGEDVEQLRLQVGPHLPPVETPIEPDFDDPPEPPHGLGGPEGGVPPLDPQTGCPVGWHYEPGDDLCHDPDDYGVTVPHQTSA